MNWTLLEIGVCAACAILTSALMEPWARILHGRIWHSFLWIMHRSHHEPRLGKFERNDALSFLHAPIAAGLVIAGCQLGGMVRATMIGVGVGMTLFGVAYVLVHDGLVHERLPMKWLLRFRLMRRVRGAHLVHHRTGGVPYGLFLGPNELLAHKKTERDPVGSAKAARSVPS